jgi:UDP-N-acetylmuramoyl-L-alanyl-D-glutamate--2,6-diaminopimelate ligase
MKLLISNLCKNLNISFFENYADLQIEGIASDSRRVGKNFLFVALAGTKQDGSRYIADAIANGASVIMIADDANLPESAQNIPILRSADPRFVLAKIASLFYQPQPDNLVAVTGTNGKSSTVHFLRELWNLEGKTAASIGTLGIIAPERISVSDLNSGLTTPDAIGLHQALWRLSNNDIQHVAIEASSHGLVQHRLEALKFKSAAFTNLSRDHLDYHGTMEEYGAAKMRLFGELLPEGALAVLNRDDSWFARAKEIALRKKLRIQTVGNHADSDWRIEKISALPDGLAFSLQHSGTLYQIKTKLFGAFQAMNLVMALVLSEPENLEQSLKNLALLPAVTGRLQPVFVTKEKRIFIDYAHTPDALEQSLNSLRAHTPKNLHVLFGCGGDRDKGKRPLMGKIASEYADKIIITDDNPRTENPAEIRREILSACQNAIEIAPRDLAIIEAIKNLEDGDTLLLAGKGHEQYQIIGTEKNHFSEVEIVNSQLREIL